MGINALFNAFGKIAGLLLAGAFSEYVSWRWLGWVNLPILGVTGFLTFFFLRTKPLQGDFKTKLHLLDWVGMVLFALGAIGVSLPLSWGGSLFHWLSWQSMFPLIFGSVLLIALDLYEKKPPEPVFPYDIFKITTTTAAILSGCVHGLLTYTVQTYFPLFYQAVFFQTPFESAISTLLFSAVVVGFSAISGVIVNSLRRYRIVLLIGWVLITTFLGLLYLVGTKTSRAEIYGFQAIAGIGVGTVLTVTAIPTQASVKRVDQTGIAAGMLVSFRLFGALIGLAIASNVFDSVFQQKIDGIVSLPKQLQPLRDASHAISFIPSLRALDLPSKVMQAVLDVYAETFRKIWLVMTCFSGAGLMIALLIKEVTIEKDEVGRQGFSATQ